MTQPAKRGPGRPRGSVAPPRRYEGFALAFAAVVKRRRLAAGMTWKDLADRVGYRDRSAIRHLELGAAPSIPFAYYIAKAFGMTLDELCAEALALAGDADGPS
jgi:transcriptional regulator with XRE-family HTH domain